ncbi:contractile injection system tape measure protein [Segetibacter aerophilus]|uniref:Uncharacterized protein n=1 Tax=Segetibacter aerophilus TaxID=670293 RepID=A0A512BIY1_9BACT|nr:contractile injection system tape measure protein [Segetibacter aerophilus]GEO11926.1 hypothetical protein SAE01_44220 [Segetibacter aerophilus]
MPPHNNHIIQTVCFDAYASTEEAAHEFTDKISSIKTESLLTQVFAQYDYVPWKIRIDQLELDLGHLEADNFGSIEELIRNQLEEVLADKLAHINGVEKRQAFTEQPQHALAPENIGSGIETLLHYLVTGSLPWNIYGKPDMEVLLVEILENEIVPFKRSILLQLSRRHVVERLATAFSFPTIRLLGEKIVGRDQTVAVEEIVVTIKNQLNAARIRISETELAVTMLTSLHESIKTGKDYDMVFIKQLLIVLIKYDAQTLAAIVGQIEIVISAETSPSRRELYRSALEQASRLVIAKELPRGQKFEKAGNDSISSPELPANKSEASYDDESSLADAEDYDQNRYFIDNGGLVLLNAALLQRYFHQLGWVKGQATADESARHKIILWLDWLIWGEHKVHEYGLLLNKIFAGVHPFEICDVRLSLAPHEKEAGVEFLQTIIHHWNILKNTSIDGFRTTFLQRQGRLINDDGGWQLHTDSKGYDILIDSLPWSFSIIKFPWMSKPLYTQWQTRT